MKSLRISILILTAGLAGVIGTNAGDSNPAEIQPTVQNSDIMTKNEIRKLIFENDGAGFAINAINDEGFASGKADPVLRRFMAEMILRLAAADVRVTEMSSHRQE